MADDCEEYGWGLGPWGEAPWAAPLEFEPGGPIPTAAPFGVYCVGPCGPITVLDTYNEVVESYSIGQLEPTVPVGDDLRLTSGGGAVADTTVRVHIQKSAPSSYTFEVSAKFVSLPDSFVDLPDAHVYLGVNTSSGLNVGMFVSRQGLLYTGSVMHPTPGLLVPNQPTQFLPGSFGEVLEGVYYTLRFAVDGENSAVYIYLTPTDQVPVTGHQLKYVVPGIPIDTAVDIPLNGTILSVKGTALRASVVDLNSICLGQGLLIPNLPPIADAGSDFSALRCSIVRLNGERSRDPEESVLAYQWRLVDAPAASREVVRGDDAITTTPTPLTNKLYSVQLGDAHAVDPIEVGDVLQFEGLFLDIATLGVDGGGFYVTVTDFLVPAPRTASEFKVLRQRGVQGANTARPTFYMDVTGAYRFTLRVFDGQLYSPDADVIVNSLESEIARGVIPDVSFVWTHLGSFWGLVEGREPLEEVWSAIAQITAAEMLTLWQHDAAKGVQGVPRLLQRKWLHYDLATEEPLPDLTSVGILLAGVTSEVIPAAGLAVSGQPVRVESAGVSEVVYLTGASLTATQIAEQLSAKLGPKYRATAYSDGSDGRVCLHADFLFQVTEAPTSVFPTGAINGPLLGTGGVPVGLSGYRVGTSLAGVGVRPGDYLVLGDTSHEILSVSSDPLDPSELQRLVLATPPALAAPSDWRIARPTTSKYLDFYGMLAADGDVARVELELSDGSLLTALVPVWGATEAGGSLLLDASACVGGSGEVTRARLAGVLRGRFSRLDPLVKEIPYLQRRIRSGDDAEVLRQNVDFFLETFRGHPCIRFVAGPGPSVWVDADGQPELPPDRLWAETTYLDNRPTIEAQYGIPMGFTLDDYAKLPGNLDYVSIVRGLWFSSLNGPAVYNLRVGAQILLGLPFAEEAGVIEEIDTEFSVTQGRLLVRDLAPPNIVRSYTYPKTLELELHPGTGAAYTVGDQVAQFAPLVSGVEVLDYIKDPEWWVPYQQQGAMFEVEKFFRFLVRVDSSAFNLATLLFVKSFVSRVKPAYTFPLFVVRRKLADATFDITDEVRVNATVRLFDGLCNARGVGYLYDDPDPSGGGFMGQFDSGAPHLAPPVYPTPAAAVYWGFDHTIICPQDYISGKFTMTLGAPAYPTVDSIYLFDSPLYTDTLYDEGTAGILMFDTAGVQLGLPVTSAGNYSLTSMSVRFDIPFPMEVSAAVELVLSVNGVDVSVVPVTFPASSGWQGFVPLPSTVNVVPGDVVRVRVRCAGLTPIHVEWATVSASLGATYTWAYDTMTPAGTYHVTRTL